MMATLQSLKQALRNQVRAIPSSSTRALCDTEYSDGFAIFIQESGRSTYRKFIIPQLSRLLTTLCESNTPFSVLEIGPGPKSVLGDLPARMRRQISRYVAFEPNPLFATRLEDWLVSTSGTGTDAEIPLPCLEAAPDIQRRAFLPVEGTDPLNGIGAETFDIVLFCHSMYGLKPRQEYIRRALEKLVERPGPGAGMVIVFHREGAVQLEGLVCHRTASFPTGFIRVQDREDTLDAFSTFVAGLVMKDGDQDRATRAQWRNICRALGWHENNHLLFSAPEVMMAFTQNSIPALQKLRMQMPSLVVVNRIVKNREAQRISPALVMRPTEIQHVQKCVQWALEHNTSLTVIGGGHSGHCLQPNIVAVDMSAFNQVHILNANLNLANGGCDDLLEKALVVAGAGCHTGDIITETTAVGLTVPLGARPSVGAGLWLQGGIGHLTRLHGLTCDTIVGAVVVSVASDSAEIICVGHVPSQHRPVGSVSLGTEEDADMLWALKGAGTNLGIVVSVVFEAFAAPTFALWNWAVPLRDEVEGRAMLQEFCVFARSIPRSGSADAYLYWDHGQLHLGLTLFETSASTETYTQATETLGQEHTSKVVDGIGLFDTELYMSGMHGGHGGGKTSSFKRCLLLKNIGDTRVANIILNAFKTRPSPTCYLHLLQGGGAMRDTPTNATAFGCRDWDFACVVTGVWPREMEEGMELSQSTKEATIQWVYKVAEDLLLVPGTGAYGADLGPDPRDAALAAKAFGLPNNHCRLARLKHKLDPYNVLAYTCPLLPISSPLRGPTVIVAVTGRSGAGKDYCAEAWASAGRDQGLVAQVVSISQATKREYAMATDADLERLLADRAYKEQHRAALTAYFHKQVRRRPGLPEEHFLEVVHGAGGVDVLFVTGMRDEAPVAKFSHLVPDSRLLEVRVQAPTETRGARRGGCGSAFVEEDDNGNVEGQSGQFLESRPSLIFENASPGPESATKFAQNHLLPCFDQDLQRLSEMIRVVPDFPRTGIDFQHVLGITQQPGGLRLCTTLLKTHFIGDWASVDTVIACEAGGFVFASPLALEVAKPMVLVRDAGKLPPPTLSVGRAPSHVSSSPGYGDKKFEMDRDAIATGAVVVVVDDVLASGETLYAVLQLLGQTGVGPEDISVMVVAEFPVHRGRELLRKLGFGRVRIQSLIVCGGI